MKLFFLLIGLYMLYLPCIPCVDQPSKQVSADLQVSFTKDHADHDHASACCSPSCICSCCASFTIYEPVVQLAFSALTHNISTYPVYITPSIKGVSLPIWQPPQLLS